MLFIHSVYSDASEFEASNLYDSTMFDSPGLGVVITIAFFYLIAHLWWWDAPLRAKQFVKRNFLGDSKAYPLPPGGMGFPFVGELPYIFLEKANDRLGNFRKRKVSRHGEICCVSIPPVGSRAILIGGHDALKWALSKEYRGLRTQYDAGTISLIGAGCLINRGNDDHKKLRSSLVHLFQPAYLRGYATTINTIVIDHLSSNWTCAEGQTKRILAYNQFQQILHKIVYVLFLGMDLEKDRTACDKMEYLWKKWTKGPFLPTIPIPGNPYIAALAARKEMGQILKNIIQTRRKLALQDKHDMISVFLERDDIDMTDEEIIDNLLLFAFAGSDTSTASLGFITRRLTQNPEVLKKVRDEHLAIRNLKDKPHAPITFEDIEEGLPYTRQILYESMRLNPAPTWMQRVAVEDLVYNNYLIPKGYKVLIDIKTMNHNPVDHPEQTMSFNPDRFQNNNDNSALSNFPGFKPFGAGARMCIGYRVALLQINIVLHHMVLDYSWTSASTEPDATINFPLPKPADMVPLDVKPTGNHTM